MKLLFGCDPEFFLKDKKTGKHVSAYGLIPGTKAEPFKIDGGAIQVDGMAVEFNIDPVDNVDDWVGNIDKVLGYLRTLLDKEYQFDFSPVATFDEEYMKEQPIEAKELGCDPDFNAYTHDANPKPNGEVLYRTASGHVHIGWTEDMNILDPEHIEACEMLVKQLDVCLAGAEKFWCEDNIRQELYGSYGTYRPKSYGVEYRVLNNSWLRSKYLQKIVFLSMKRATENLLNGEDYSANFPTQPNKLFKTFYQYSGITSFIDSRAFTSTFRQKFWDVYYDMEAVFYYHDYAERKEALLK